MVNSADILNARILVVDDKEANVRMLGEMTVLATSLRRLSEKIEDSPGGLLLGRRPVPPGPGEGTAK